MACKHPSSARGKGSSSKRPRKDDLTTQTLPILERDRKRFGELAEQFRAYYDPQDTIEADLVDRLIMARWNLSNSERLMIGYFDIAASPDRPEPKRITEIGLCRTLAKAFMADARTNVFTKILRYKQDAQRTADRIHPILDEYRLQRLLDYCKTKPTSAPEPEPADQPQVTETIPQTHPDPAPESVLEPVAKLPLTPASRPLNPPWPTLALPVSVSAQRTNMQTPARSDAERPS